MSNEKRFDLIFDIKHCRLLVESMFFFQNECSVNGEREVDDSAEQVEDQEEHQRLIDFSISKSDYVIVNMP